MDKQDMIRRMSGFVRDTMKESGETVFGAPQFVTRKQVATFMGKKDPHQIDWALSCVWNGLQTERCTTYRTWWKQSSVDAWLDDVLYETGRRGRAREHAPAGKEDRRRHRRKENAANIGGRKETEGESHELLRHLCISKAAG